MKALVAVKRVIDPYVKIRLKPDNSDVETQGVKMAMNPFDEIALEQALRWREQAIVSEIVLVSVGHKIVQETLRHGLAMGADKAILVENDDPQCSLNIAKILQKIAEKEQPSLILMGKQATDSDNNQTPQMLAALLNWPQATFVSKLELNDKMLTAVREIDGGLETLAMPLPAVISTDLRLNQPRYASLPNIMKAKQKPLEVVPLADLALNLNVHQNILSRNYPHKRQQKGRVLASVDELIHTLKNKAHVL